MTISPETRDLAQRLLTYEAAAGKSSMPLESATLRTYERLRQCIVSFAGVASFQSIAVRALMLAQVEVPSLCAVQVSANGSLQGISDSEHRVTIDIDQAGNQQSGEDPPGEAGSIFIAWILNLLLTFLGEALTLSLLRDAWPDATFHDRSSGNGRKA